MTERESMDHPPGLPETEVPGEEPATGQVEMLDLYLKRAAECTEGVQKLSSRKFNNEQCEYLADKLKVAVQSASSFLEVSLVDHHGSGSSEDMARHVEIFKLLLVLAKLIESFIQGCCKDGWIQAAMTLTNVSEFVASIGFNLELCRVAFCKECAATGSLTLDQVDDINKAEVEIVNTKASVDVDTLFEKVILELNHFPSENRDLACYLLQRLRRVKPIPAFVLSKSSLWSIKDDGGFFGKLFMRVKKTKRLGIGASGATVYKAMWLGTQVAMKTFYVPEDPEFMREVEILGGLCHPNVTSMFCSAMDSRRCSIVMELMDEDLHALMQRRLDSNPDSPPFSIWEAVDIMHQIAEGVNYLHNKHIMHRDLKSFNVLVKYVKATKSEIGYVHVKVADFGLSKIKENNTRYSNQTLNMGTNRWMAPEIIKFHNVGSQGSTSGCEKVPRYPFKCDVYSFAMVCCEILNGAIPFSAISNPNTVKERVMRGERPELPAHCPCILKALIEKCWNHVPNKRPSFADICLELKYLKCLFMTGFSSHQDPHLTTEEPLQATTHDTPLQAPTVPNDTPLQASTNFKPGLTMIQGLLNGVLAVMNWFTDICSWKSPVTTILVHVLYLILVWYPELFLPTVFLYMFLIGSWNYRFRSRTPPFMDAKLSQGEYIGDLDELEEEFNDVLANRAHEILEYRYERLRSVAAWTQYAFGDLASMGEKLHSWLSWRDPGASAVFSTFCLISTIILYWSPLQVLAALLGVYVLRHPWFRDHLPF